MPSFRSGGALLVVVCLLASCGRLPSTPALRTPTPTSEVAEPIVSGGNVQLPLAAPTRLKVGEASFDVLAVEIQKGQWRYQRGHPDSAQWVHGTLINYVIGLEATTRNQDLFQALTGSDVMELAVASGRVLRFQFSGRQWVEQEAAPDVFQQLRPGLTLVLLGDKGAKRLVVTASYVSSQEPALGGGEGLAQAGTWIQVGETRVMALEGQVKSAPGLPEGYVYYLVDFGVENTGAGPLDASMFQMDLIDGLNKRYAVSVQASQIGKYGPAGGQLEPGQALTATAGYMVPANINGPALVWTFSPRPGTQLPARVQLALAPPAPTPDPRDLITVQVNAVAYNNDLSGIVVTGGIGNPTQATVVVNGGDVWLESSSARMPLFDVNPPFPWSIAPGESRAFTLQFARPAPGTAILHILQWSFELSGLR